MKIKHSNQDCEFFLNSISKFLDFTCVLLTLIVLVKRNVQRKRKLSFWMWCDDDLAAVAMKITVVWDVKPCGVVEVYWCLQAITSHCLQNLRLVPWHHIQEDNIIILLNRFNSFWFCKHLLVSVGRNGRLMLCVISMGIFVISHNLYTFETDWLYVVLALTSLHPSVPFIRTSSHSVPAE
jgi:hypothetical protein